MLTTSKASPEKNKGPTSVVALLNLDQKDGTDHRREKVEVNVGFESAVCSICTKS